MMANLAMESGYFSDVWESLQAMYTHNLLFDLMQHYPVILIHRKKLSMVMSYLASSVHDVKLYVLIIKISNRFLVLYTVEKCL